MNRERRGEPWTAELPDDIEDPRVVGSLSDDATQVRRVKLAVRTRSSPDLIVQLALPWIRCLSWRGRFRLSAFRTG